MAGCTLEDLVTTEREVIDKISGLDYPQKLKDRVINLTRRTFRLHRGLAIAELLIQKKKDKLYGQLQSSNHHWQPNSGRGVALHAGGNGGN
jgi:dUTPase